MDILIKHKQRKLNTKCVTLNNFMETDALKSRFQLFFYFIKWGGGGGLVSSKAYRKNI